MDHHDVVDQHHCGADRESAASCEILSPRRDPRTKFETVEVDVPESENRRSEAVAPRVTLLHDHPVRKQRADDAVHGRRRQLEPLRDLAETHPVVARQHRQHAKRAVYGLNHPDILAAIVAAISPEERSPLFQLQKVLPVTSRVA